MFCELCHKNEVSNAGVICGECLNKTHYYYPVKKYIKDTICSKCGEEHIRTEFYQNELIYNDFGRIKRTCINCGYVWYEKSLDDNSNYQLTNPPILKKK